MLARTIAALSLLIGLSLVGAGTASAAPGSGDFTIAGRLSCTAADRTGDWRVVVTPTTDTGRRIARAEYTLLGPDGRRGFISMPIGRGVISVFDVSIEGPHEPTHVSRRTLTRRDRHECRFLDPGAPAGTVGIVYVAPPRRPTPAQVEAYCDGFAEQHGEDHWESQRCDEWLLAQVGALPQV